jgi:hypothetical protein
MIIRTDTKETVWYRRFYEVPDNTPIEKILEQIDDGTLDSYEGEYLLDTSENMTIEENDGQCVFEMYDESENVLYTDELNESKSRESLSV